MVTLKQPQGSRSEKGNSQPQVRNPVYGPAKLRFSPVSNAEGAMRRIQVWAEQSWASLRDAAGRGATVAVSLWTKGVFQVRKIVDSDRWAVATTWQDRAAAVSWPRASIVGALAATLIVSVWLVAQPSGIRSHPPRLPTEQEWRANRAAAEAMEADLSPARAAANHTVRPGEQP
jgi:hypothetical protein